MREKRLVPARYRSRLSLDVTSYEERNATPPEQSVCQGLVRNASRHLFHGGLTPFVVCCGCYSCIRSRCIAQISVLWPPGIFVNSAGFLCVIRVVELAPFPEVMGNNIACFRHHGVTILCAISLSMTSRVANAGGSEPCFFIIL